MTDLCIRKIVEQGQGIGDTYEVFVYITMANHEY